MSPNRVRGFVQFKFSLMCKAVYTYSQPSEGISYIVRLRSGNVRDKKADIAQCQATGGTEKLLFN